MKLTIRTKDVHLTDDIKKYVDEKIGALDKYYSKVIDGHVDLELYTHHHKNGPFFRAVVDIRLPNKVLRAEKNHVDIKSALDGIKDELKKQLMTYKDAFDAKIKRDGRLMKKQTQWHPKP